MQKHLLFLLAIIFSINTYSQILFENGYYIDNSNNKINCLIKNVDWKNNPTEFEYKLSENGEPVKINITSVKEFGINKTSKYIRDNVNIDRSGKNINYLSTDKNPVYNKETLFLKVLVEGRSNLYEYVDGNLARYFYSKNDFDIEQLIFKKYKTREGNILYNNRFRQQLWTNLKCSNIELRRIENLDYKKNDLIEFFTDYSECHNSDFISFEQKEKKKRDLFNLTIRPRLNNSSLSIQNSFSDFRKTDFENKIGLGLGIEAEFILPFNKNKWAITIEPTYQNYNSKKATEGDSSRRTKLVANVDYSSIEIPLGIRHYFFLNSDSKLFVNASFIIDMNSKSVITFRRTSDGSKYSDDLDIYTRNNFAVGLGYKFKNKYSVELRHQTDREVLSDYLAWSSDYTQLSVVFGYSVF